MHSVIPRRVIVFGAAVNSSIPENLSMLKVCELHQWFVRKKSADVFAFMQETIWRPKGSQ